MVQYSIIGSYSIFLNLYLYMCRKSPPNVLRHLRDGLHVAVLDNKRSLVTQPST